MSSHLVFTTSLDSLTGVSQQLQVVDYASVALLVILIYEGFDLLPREVNFIWSRRWGFISAVYFFCRYVPVLMITLTLITFHGPIESCSSGFYAVIALSFASLIVSELCFIVRAYAVWGASRSAALFFSILTAGMICALALDLSRLRTTQTINFGSPLSLCGIGGPASCAMWGLIIILLIDAIVIVMMVWAKRRRYNASEMHPLFETIYRDSAMYFFLNSLTTAVAIVLYMKTPGLAIISSRLASALTSAIASRMIIGLKEQGDNSITSSRDMLGHWSTPPMSAIQFRSGDVAKT
ncbi:hypothetical protein D9756_002775 [Leucocoprinus leucothites]|uniref:DUF6533 domain-containing protein n=1 Tax=Leucocoprinus leucothites TaxID=201217 RepID=A0A8H5LMA7_9AGAR|nr:hypothetical protein D9756_002775 [Leucoagaricus leucothites]